MELPRRYPLHEFPFARNAEEETYYRRAHYFVSALWAFDAGDEVLNALHQVWEQVIAQAGTQASAGAPAGWPANGCSTGRAGRTDTQWKSGEYRR